jgi:hypothetical protein
VNTLVTSFVFPVPQVLLRERIWGKLKPSARSLYIVLLYIVENRGSLSVTVTDADIRELAGASTSSLRQARTELRQFGLIDCRRREGGKYRYVLCPAPEMRLASKNADSGLPPELVHNARPECVVNPNSGTLAEKVEERSGNNAPTVRSAGGAYRPFSVLFRGW